MILMHLNELDMDRIRIWNAAGVITVPVSQKNVGDVKVLVSEELSQLFRPYGDSLSEIVNALVLVHSTIEAIIAQEHRLPGQC